MGVRHLLECGQCAEQVRKVLDLAAERSRAADVELPAGSLLARRLRERLGAREAAEGGAGGEPLLDLPASEWLEELERRGSFRAMAAAVSLLDRAARAIGKGEWGDEQSRSRAYQRASVIAAVVEELRGVREDEEGMAVRLGWVAAELLRIEGDLAGSGAAFQATARVLESAGLRDRERLGLCRGLARLRWDEELVDEALALLGRAAELAAENGEGGELGEILAERGRLLLEELEAPSALLCLEAACGLLEPAVHRRTALEARLDVARCHVHLGRPGEAERVLGEARREFEAFALGAQALDLVEGEIAEARGDGARAEALYAATLRAGEEAGMDRLASGLGLARLLAGQGRREEMESVLDEVKDLSRRVLALTASCRELVDRGLLAARSGAVEAVDLLGAAIWSLSWHRMRRLP